MSTDRFEEAVALYNKGDPAAARQILETLVSTAPDHAPAWHLLGVLRSNAGDKEAARQALERAVALAPDYVEALCNLGLVLQQLGDLSGAAERFGRAATLDPGNLAAAEGRAKTLWGLERIAEAADPLRHLSRLKPDDRQVAGRLLAALRRARRFEEAEAEARRFIERFPDDSFFLVELGGILRDRRLPEAALEVAQRAQAKAPANIDTTVLVAAALSDLERLEEAAAIFEEVLRRKPDHVDAMANLGGVRYRLGDPDGAIESYRRALAQNPQHVSTHWNLSHALLQKGDYRAGWAEYEWRWKTEKAALIAERRNFPWPRWEGGPIAGKRLLVHTEQGFGDSIQFLRYVPIVAKLGAIVTLEVQKELLRLCQSLAGVRMLMPRGLGLSNIDLQIPVMSFPHVLGTTVETIPQNLPYLGADTAAVAAWRERLADLPRPWIGVCWKGNRKYSADHRRSVPAAVIKAMFDSRPAGYVALMKDLEPGELAAAGLDRQVREVASELGDFADTAALVSALDLVITVDTSVGHLAGALDKPVWLLLPEPADFRWLRGRSDSPWYPSARLFRQPVAHDWSAVIAQVITALREFR